MCLGIPLQVVNLKSGAAGEDPDVAVVTGAGVEKEIRLDIVDRLPEPGEYVIVHAGFAIHSLSADEAEKQRELLAALRLPVRLELDFSFNEVMEIMAHDKKNRGGGFTLALPRAIGRGEVVRGVDPAECRAILEAAR